MRKELKGYVSSQAHLVEDNVGAIELSLVLNSNETIASKRVTIYDDMVKNTTGWGNIIFDGTIEELINKLLEWDGVTA